MGEDGESVRFKRANLIITLKGAHYSSSIWEEHYCRKVKDCVKYCIDLVMIYKTNC